MPNIICIKYIYLWLYSSRRCSLTIHQLVEKSQAGAKCGCPFFLRPLQTTRYLGVFLPLTNTARNWPWHGPGKAGRHSLLFRDRETVGSWSEEHLRTDTAVRWECLSQLSGNGCSNGTDSTQMLQGQFEPLLESPVDWSNSIAQVLERWKFKARPYPSHTTNDI